MPSCDGAGYLTMLTRRGKIKRADISEFTSVRPSGLIAVALEEGDQLGWVKLTHGADEIIVVTQLGRALRFAESSVRPMGRGAGGVRAIRLAAGDAVAGMDVVDPTGEVLLVTANGHAKRTPMAEYTAHSRHGAGMRTLSRTAIATTGPLIHVRVVSEEDEIALISAEGMVVRLSVSQISRQGRVTRGVIAMRLKEGDNVAAVALLTPKAAREELAEAG